MGAEGYPIGCDGLSWEAWIARLNEEIKLHRVKYFYGEIDAVNGREAWYQSFEDGLSPKEALEEDMSRA